MITVLKGVIEQLKDKVKSLEAEASAEKEHLELKKLRTVPREANKVTKTTPGSPLTTAPDVVAEPETLRGDYYIKRLNNLVLQ